MNVSLTGKTILITGGTSVLGAAFIKKAVQAGAKIFFTFYSNESFAEEIKRSGASGFHVDLQSRAEINALFDQIKSQTETLDGLIHNAAITKDRLIQNIEETEWQSVLDVNLNSVYWLTKKMLHLFLKAERSKILNIVSAVGLRGGFGQASYAASKGGLIALTKSLAKELGSRKILVNALNPGFMESKMTRELPADIVERNMNRSVLKEISDPNEMADFMVYLMSDQVKRVSGQIFNFESRVD